MSILTINGWAPTISVDKFTKDTPWAAEQGMTPSGLVVDKRLLHCQSFSGSLVLQSASDAEKARQLIEGQGEHFSFNQVSYSARGFLPTGTFEVTAAIGVGDGYGVRVTSGNAMTINPSNEYYWSGKWTVLFSHKEDGEATSAFETYGVRSSDTTSTQYKNGTAGTHAIANMLDFTDPSVQGFIFASAHSDGTAGTVDYDNITVLPWEASDEQLDIWTVNGFEFSPLPALDISLSIESTSKQFVGTVKTSKYKQARIGTQWEQDAKIVPFKMEKICVPR